MKNNVFTALILLPAIVLAVSGALDSHPGSSATSGIQTVTGLLSHHVLKRQAISDLTTQDVIDCTTAIVNYQCGSSGYAQNVADIALGCGNDSYASTVADACAKNSKGDICSATATRFILEEIQSTGATSCLGVVSSGSCPETCLNFLLSASSELGCCINTYVNKTTSPLYSLYSNYVDYRLWRACGVDLPPSACSNLPISLNRPTDAQTCTQHQLNTQFLQYECRVGQPLVDAILRNSRCYFYARLLVDICATNANNVTCGEVLSLDFSGSSTSTDFSNSLITNLGSNCFSTTFCSSSCRSAIENVKNAYGCCVNNIFNNSDLIGVQPTYLSYGVWQACGADSPGFCKSMLSGSATIRAFAWVIAVAITAIVTLKI